MILIDHRDFGRRRTLFNFEALKLTKVEYQRILDFDFPEVRASGFHIIYGSSYVECTCGEDTVHSLGSDETVITCACGRKWNVHSYVTPHLEESLLEAEELAVLAPDGTNVARLKALPLIPTGQ